MYMQMYAGPLQHARIYFVDFSLCTQLVASICLGDSVKDSKISVSNVTLQGLTKISRYGGYHQGENLLRIECALCR